MRKEKKGSFIFLEQEKEPLLEVSLGPTLERIACRGLPGGQRNLARSSNLKVGGRRIMYSLPSDEF